MAATGESPSGKASDFDSDIRRFDPCLPCQDKSACHADRSAGAVGYGCGLTKRVIPITRFLFLLIRLKLRAAGSSVAAVNIALMRKDGRSVGLVRITNAGCKGGLR